MVANFTPQDIARAATQPQTGISTDSLSLVVLATVILYTILTTVFTAARLVTKRVIASWALEDYVLFLAWAFGMAYVFVVYSLKEAGSGQHMWLLSLPDITLLFKLTWAIEILYCLTVWITKMALLLQLIRVFAPTKKGGVYWITIGLIWANSAFYLTTFFVVIFRCMPQEKIWNPLVPGQCIGDEIVLIVTGAVNMVSDLLIFLLPLWATWHLSMKLRYKVGICAVFATALFALVSSVGRFAYTLPIFYSPDLSYIAAQTSLWSVAEIGSIILCTCFPMMPRFFKLVTEKTSDYRSKYSWGRGTASNGTYGADFSSKKAHAISGPRSGPTPWADDMNRVEEAKSRYIPLGDEETGLAKAHGNHTGIRKTTDIGMTR